MTAIATYIINAKDGYPTDLRRERGVFSGFKHFMIKGAASIGETFDATDLPVSGDPFDALHPQCKAAAFKPVLLPGSHGFYKMRIDYREDDYFGGGGITPVEGLVLTTTLQQSKSSVNTNVSVDTPPKKLTNNDVGVSKIVNVATYLVKQYSAALPNIAPLTLLSDSPKTNISPISLINFMGVEGATIDFEAKQLLYGGYTLGREGGFFTITHELLSRRSWENERDLLNASNEPTGTKEMSNVYEAVDFGSVPS